MFSEMEDGPHESDADPFGDDNTERNNDDLSETEISKIKLYDGIKKMVENSVEVIRKQRTERKKKRKRTIGNGGEACYNREDTNAYSRCTLPYLSKVIESITCSDHRISLVRKMGFEETLHIADCYIPRLFAQWIADKINPREEVIEFDEKSIPINPKSFEDVLGIPAGPLPVLTDEDSGKAAFLGFFGLSEVPTIKYFGEKIINNKDLGDDEFCMCYGAVVLCSFICPNSSPRPSTKYLGALADVQNIGNRNWCKFAHEWMMWYIKKYLKERAKQNKLTLTLGGCIYHMSVRYLDFIDLGPIKLPSTLPRIRVWKGDLIKHFSEMDKGKDGNYGSHVIKDVADTCYAPPSIASTQQERGQNTFKNEIARVAGEHMSKEVKNDLFDAFQSHMIDASPETYEKAQFLVIDFLKIIVSEGVTKPPSETTFVVSQGSTDQDHEVHKGKKQRCSDNTKEDHLSETNIEFQSNPQGKLGASCQEKQVNQTKDVFTEHAKTIEATVTRMRSFSLNHTPSADEGGSSLSISKRQVKPSFSEKEVSKLQAEQVKIQGRYINTMACLEEDYIGGDPKPSDFATREEYLKEAIKKYHFNDPSFPSMRLFDDVDDNGKQIEEPELWRPLPGDTIEYGNFNVDKVQEQFKVNNLNDVPQDDGNSCQELGSQFEVNISSEKLEMNNGYYSPPHQGNTSYVYSPPKQRTLAYQSNADSDFQFSSIQCAQRQLSYCFPKQKVDEAKEIIDLDPSTEPSQPSQLTPTRKENPKSCIKGRRLFDSATSSAENENTPAQSVPQKLKQQMSPEVQYLGERSFNSVCNNMSARTDELYNAGLTLGSASMSCGKENLPPKRVINRSNWLRSPYENNQKPALDPKHVRLHEILTTLCDDPDYQYKYIINIDECKVWLKQLGTSMKQDGWVEAWVVNAFCRKLFKDNHPRKSQKHWFFHTSSEYFLEKWPNEFMRNKWKDGIMKGFKGANSARSLHLSHRLHFPSLYERHWFLFLVDLVARKFLFLDSFYGEGTSYHNKIDNLMIANFRKVWSDCKLKDMGFENFDIFFPNVPKQKTPNDCGIFTMKFMEFYCPRNPSSISFSAIDIPDFRVQIAIDQVWNEYNSEIENAYLMSSFDLEAYKTMKI